MSYISSSINSIEKHCDYNKEKTAEQLTISPTATAWHCSELMKYELERQCCSTLSVPYLGKTAVPGIVVSDALSEVLQTVWFCGWLYFGGNLTAPAQKKSHCSSLTAHFDRLRCLLLTSSVLRYRVKPPYGG